jgi:hypothetical protein
MLKRTSTIVGLAVAVLVMGTAPVFADPGWGSAACSQYPTPGCELRAGTGGSNGGNLGGVSPGRHGSSGNGNSGSTDPSGGGGDRIVGEGANLAQCQYQLSDYQWPPPGGGPRPAAFVVPPEPGAVTTEPAVFHLQGEPVTAQVAMVSLQLADAPEPSGAWYVYKCTGPGLRDGVYRPPVWMPHGQPGASPSPAELAQQARSQLRLPAPKIKANPAGDQLVGLPTWLWLDRGSWGPVSATAAVPGVSVTAVATPTSVTWSMGDGGSVTCTGPGTPFPSGGDPKSASPVCGYTYHTSSAGRPGDAFPVTATVDWTVRWSGAGQGGTFPNITTSETLPFRVAESEAITTR